MTLEELLLKCQHHKDDWFELVVTDELIGELQQARQAVGIVSGMAELADVTKRAVFYGIGPRGERPDVTA